MFKKADNPMITKKEAAVNDVWLEIEDLAEEQAIEETSVEILIERGDYNFAASFINEN
jgi:hypothetical protein